MTNLLFCVFVICIHGLHIDRLDVPTKLEVGANASLKCHFDSKGKEIIMVAWYFNHQQFYVYKPWYSNNPINVYQLEDNPLQINKEKSNIRTVIILNITAKAEGYYTCEIITGPPRFEGTSKTAWMNVIVTNHGTTSFIVVLHSLFFNNLLLNLVK